MTDKDKQPFRDYINKQKHRLQMNLGDDGSSFYLAFYDNPRDAEIESCKESFLYDVSDEGYSQDCFAISAGSNAIERTLKFWARKDLPEFNYEIIELGNDVQTLLIFNSNEVFQTNFLYLDVLATVSRAFSRTEELVKSITDLIPNDGNYKGLRDGFKLILDTPPDVIMNLKINFIDMNHGAGVGKAFSRGILQNAIKNHK